MTPFIGRIIVQAMGTDPSGPSRSRPSPTFTPDGFWWWEGGHWRSAISADGRWRWNGQAGEPYRTAPPPRAGGGATTAVLVTILAFGGIVALVGILVAVSLYAMGGQISNVFSNVVAALGATPSP